MNAMKYAENASGTTWKIRRLSGTECLEAEGLWREVFREDSALFTDYYFSQKAAKNRGLVLEGEDGIRAMLYLTPEQMLAAGQHVESAYIVGVATKSEWRHRGYMAALLGQAYALLYKERMPFVFLMPASPDIYTPFGFTWIYDRPVWNSKTFRPERLKRMEEADAQRMADFASAFLKDKKSVYVLRDSAYYKQQIAELEAQNGCIFGAEDAKGALCGLWMYTCEEGTAELLEVLAEKDRRASVLSPVTEHKPAIMGRIICAETMLKLLRSSEPVEFVLQITDPLIGENNGSFICRLTPDRAVIERVKAEEKTAGAPSENAAWKEDPEKNAGFIKCISMDITQLTAVLFGALDAPETFPGSVRFLSPVWINEIV
ncbi:MAG: GNAT family N-acetyltransferase [Lachnospiraceae bacterium]|nr:GNAT family N-acetyltransferase [Lachnospiraceae bacterium]